MTPAPILPTRLVQVADQTARLARIVEGVLARRTNSTTTPEVRMDGTNGWLITAASAEQATAIHIELRRQGEDSNLVDRTTVRVTDW